MTFVSILSDASAQQGAGAPAWLVPVITGAVGLAGTIIGGTITFLSTRSADKRKEAAERDRQKKAQIKDVAVRFLQTLSNHGIDSLKVKDTAARLRIDVEATRSEAASKRKAAENESSAPQAAPEPNERPDTTPDESIKSQKLLAAEEKVRELQAEMVTAQAKLDEHYKVAEYFNLVTRTLPEIEHSAKERDAIINEMYPILPNSTIHKAERASSAVLMRQLTAYLPDNLRTGHSVSRDAVNEFVTDIRGQLGMGAFTPAPKDTDIDQLVAKIMTEVAEDRESTNVQST